jgi:hypothetical protein
MEVPVCKVIRKPVEKITPITLSPATKHFHLIEKLYTMIGHKISTLFGCGVSTFFVYSAKIVSRLPMAENIREACTINLFAPSYLSHIS